MSFSKDRHEVDQLFESFDWELTIPGQYWIVPAYMSASAGYIAERDVVEIHFGGDDPIYAIPNIEDLAEVVRHVNDIECSRMSESQVEDLMAKFDRRYND
jgi:hypothetical protein